MKIFSLLPYPVVTSILKAAFDTPLARPFISYHTCKQCFSSHDQCARNIKSARMGAHHKSNVRAGRQNRPSAPSSSSAVKDPSHLTSVHSAQIFRLQRLVVRPSRLSPVLHRYQYRQATASATHLQRPKPSCYMPAGYQAWYPANTPHAVRRRGTALVSDVGLGMEKARSKPRGTKPCSVQDVPGADYAHVRVASASIRLCTQPTHQGVPRPRVSGRWPRREPVLG